MQSTLFVFGLLFASVLAGLPATVVEVVVNNAQLSILEAQVLKLNLATALENPVGNFTVFAPSDTAFGAASITGTSDVPAAIITFHVLSGASAILAAGVPTIGTGVKLTTISTLPQKLRARRYLASDNFTASVIINAIPVSQADIIAENGVVHIIDGVLLPSNVNLTIAQVASGVPTLSTLLAAVGAASSGIQGALGTDGITVFAPTDAAFTAFDALLQSAFNITLAKALENQAVVDAILAYHVLPNNVIYSKALDSSKSVTAATALTGSPVRIAFVGGSPKVIGATTTATITGLDVLASNGVVHVIDTVLVPDVAAVAALLATTAPAATTPSAAGIFGASFMMIVMSLLAYFL